MKILSTARQALDTQETLMDYQEIK